MKPIHPMLAVPGRPFSKKGWIFEPKFDGTRAIAFVTARGVILQNRRLKDITARYPEIVSGLRAAARQPCILDGEITVLTADGIDFTALQRREQQTKPLKIEYLSHTLPAIYIIFDILAVEDTDLTGKPLLHRKSVLADSIQPNDTVAVIDYVFETGETYYAAAKQLGLEGIVAKKTDSLYQPGIRSQDWVKIKRQLILDLVVGGFTFGRGRRGATFGALLVGAYNPDGDLIYVGRAGSGFSGEDIQAISNFLKNRSTSLFSNPPTYEGVTWTDPDLVVEIRAQEVTSSRRLRAPVFRRVRWDKSPHECTIDQLEYESS